MSYRGNTERNSKYNHKNIQAKREFEKIRRHQQYKFEVATDEPVFAHPIKKVSADRQDSLTRNIASVLGDPGVVAPILFSSGEPNMWLGTSRGDQSQSISTGCGSQQSCGYLSSTMKLPMSDSTVGNDKSLSISRPNKSQSLNRGELRRCSQRDRFPKHASMLNSVNLSKTASMNEDFAQRVNTERDRVSSVDSDILGGVENILKEMVDLPPSITEIKTPSVNEAKFNFTTCGISQRRLGETGSGIKGTLNDLEPASDEDSSDSRTSDDENNSSAWTLKALMQASKFTEHRRRMCPSDQGDNDISPSKRKCSAGYNTQRIKVSHLDSSTDALDNSPKYMKKSFSMHGALPQVKTSNADHNMKHTMLTESTSPSEKIYSVQSSEPLQTKAYSKHRDSKEIIHHQTHGRVRSSSSSSNSSFTNPAPEDIKDSTSFELISNHQKIHQRVSGKPNEHKNNRSKFEMIVKDDTSWNLNSNREVVSPCIGDTVQIEINRFDGKSKFAALWVKLKSTIIIPENCRSNASMKTAFSKKSKVPQKKKNRSTVSVGSETEQPVRRTNDIQYVEPDRSTDWNEQSSFNEPAHDEARINGRQGEDSNWHQLRPSASVVLPDSSLPGEQERIETPDWYMREGKRMKHEGDGMVDSRTGRTRQGEALTRALSYFEASLFFIMSGHVMENENFEDRTETPSPNPHCPTNMYQQTLPLLDFVLKMRSRAEQDDNTFKRVIISCLKCQSFLYFRIFHLKKETAIKNSELLTKQFEVIGKSAQIHSPWRNPSAAPNVLSPMSPAVPSPFTHYGPSPVSSSEQVSSSTQVGRMTPSSHNNYSLPQKIYDIYRQHHAIMSNLLLAHEKWDLAEIMLEDHVDFFRNIDALSNISLTFHSSLKLVFLYYRMVLRQLRALMMSSPT